MFNDSLGIGKKAVGRVLFFSYTVLLAWGLFLGNLRSFDGMRRYNLIPFETIARYLKYSDLIGMKFVLINLLGNIFAFVPLGFFLPWMFKMFNRFSVIFLVMGISLTVETMQLVFNVGSFDVDDILLNTIGGLIGYVVYLGSCRGRGRI